MCGDERSVTCPNYRARRSLRLWLLAVAALAAASVSQGALADPSEHQPRSRLSGLASVGLPASWQRLKTGPAGGSIWLGLIPSRLEPRDRRASAIYLPPGYSPQGRYPVLYLLHGL